MKNQVKMNHKMAGKTERTRLPNIGKKTPFAKVRGMEFTETYARTLTKEISVMSDRDRLRMIIQQTMFGKL